MSHLCHTATHPLLLSDCLSFCHLLLTKTRSCHRSLQSFLFTPALTTTGLASKTASSYALSCPVIYVIFWGIILGTLKHYLRSFVTLERDEEEARAMGRKQGWMVEWQVISASTADQVALSQTCTKHISLSRSLLFLCFLWDIFISCNRLL